ncbi:MAG: DUF4214 domain-containing protein [Aquihabitans sp.]
MRQLRNVAAGFVAGAILLAGFAAAQPATAEDGAGVDWAFGPAALAGNGPWQLAVDSQDRTVAVGRRILQRFDADGTPDAAFGNVDLPVSIESPALRLLDDGTISVLGASGSSVVIQRFDSTGSPVASFGAAGVLQLPPAPGGRRLAQAGDGTLYVEQAATSSSVSVARYDETGAIDPSYGSDGIATLPCCGGGPLSLGIADLAANADGSLDVLVAHEAGGAVIRVDGAGAPVTSADLPTSATARPQHLVAMPDGSLLAVGFDSSQPYTANGTIRRVTAGGALDGAFGDAGLVSFRSGTWRSPIEQAGRVVLVIGDSTDTELLAVGPTGLDPAFGTAGRVKIAGPSSIYAISYQVRSIRTIGLSDGRILTMANASWMSVNQIETPRRTTVTELTADGVQTSSTDTSASWVGELAPRHDGTASVVFSATAPLYTPVPNVAYVARWIPVDPDAPMGPVRDLTAAVDGTTATVSWKGPVPVRGLQIKGYKGRVVRPSSGAVVTSWSAGQLSVLVDQLHAGQAYRVEVRAVGPQGEGPLPSSPLIVIPHFASVQAFADRLATDFGLPTPTAAEVDTLAAALDAGTIEPEFAVRQVADGPTWRTQLDPVIRLYSAYFGRLPDPSGLRYWMAKRASGTTIARISSAFAGSSEFKRTYGTLTDRAFVELVYQNVLGRAGDPGGIAYWTKRVADRTTSRGQVMASFSESTEHVRRLDRTVQTVGLYWGMLQRVPTSTEVQNWAGPSPAGDEAALARTLLTSSEYLARLD